MKFFSLICVSVLLMIIIPLNSLADESETLQSYVDGVEYVYTIDENNSAEIIRGIPDADVYEINIPENLNGFTVLSISEFAFRGLVNIKSVVIPDNVEFLGKGAFMSCSSLNYVSIGDGIIEIPDDCFFSCVELTDVIFPDELESIGTEAFFSCPNVDIEIPESVISIGENSIGIQSDPHSGSFIPIYGFLIKGKNGSVAQEYADKNGLDFIDMSDYEEGDVDFDGQITTTDASLTLSEYVCISTNSPILFTKKQKIVADMNGDGIIEPDDASMILEKYAYISTLLFE